MPEVPDLLYGRQRTKIVIRSEPSYPNPFHESSTIFVFKSDDFNVKAWSSINAVAEEVIPLNDTQSNFMVHTNVVWDHILTEVQCHVLDSRSDRNFRVHLRKMDEFWPIKQVSYIEHGEIRIHNSPDSSHLVDVFSFQLPGVTDMPEGQNVSVRLRRLPAAYRVQTDRVPEEGPRYRYQIEVTYCGVDRDKGISYDSDSEKDDGKHGNETQKGYKNAQDII